MSAIYSFLTYVHYKQTQTSSDNVENTAYNSGLDRLGATLPDPSPSLFGFRVRPTLWESAG